MHDLKRIIRELSRRDVTRKQFIVLVCASFVGMISIFRILQDMNTPELATSTKGVFGEREYGRPDAIDVAKAKAESFGRSLFG